MTLSGRKICVALPDTVLEEHDSLRDKTAKLGQIARSCSVFGVDLIRVFHDPRGRGESSLIRRVLEYLETPQYLRRRLVPLSDDLKFAGLLPPLRIPSHKPRVPLGELSAGAYREGFVLPDGASVDIGLDAQARLKRREAPNRRVTVRVTSTSPLEAVIVRREDVDEYWGYVVDVCGAKAMLADTSFPLKVATSRRGEPLCSVNQKLREDFRSSRGLMLIFGSPSRGLFEILGNGLKGSVTCTVNLYPEQHVVTVRTEEAITCALYLLETFCADAPA